MATTLAGSVTIAASFVYTNPFDYSTVTEVFQVGTTPGFPSLDFNITDGTGADQAQIMWSDERTIAGTTADNLDLAGGTTSNLTGAAITLAKLKGVIIKVKTPATGVVLRVGPRNVTNAAQLWFGGVGTTNYEDISHELIRTSRIDGWTITAGTGDLLGIYNPGGSSLTYCIWLMGI